VIGLIQRHGIDCDLKTTGHLDAACKTREIAGLAAEVDCLDRVMRYPHAAMLDAAETRREVESPLFHGALLDRLGGHLHPLNYTLGLAEAALRSGVRIFENTTALRMSDGAAPVVTTASGEVRARYVVLACDAFLGDLAPALAGRMMPVANYIVATEPLPDPKALIAQNRAVSDTKFVVDYFRLSADGRLLFGGGERYTPNPPADIAAFVRPFMERVFPQLRGVGIDSAWGGMVSVTRTRMPDIGRRGAVFWAHGYSGKGVILTSLAGKLVAEAVAGTAERFDLMASIAPPPFPGGRSLRSPLYVLGMLWYALRDRL
jgi:gamma-glutamylputrescine oxidase